MEALANNVTHLDDLIQRIKSQDQEDERYILKKKLLPLLIGLLFFTTVIMIAPIKNILLFTGCFLIFVGMIGAVIIYLLEYKNISKETFDLSLFEFLKQKEKRLKLWKIQPVRHHILYALYIVGVVMMILGNTGKIRILKTTQNIIIYIGVILIALCLSGIIGEYLYRKRHKNKHQPLLQIISDLKEELQEEKNNA